MIKNMTYRNLMIVIRKIEKKGYTFVALPTLLENR